MYISKWSLILLLGLVSCQSTGDTVNVQSDHELASQSLIQQLEKEGGLQKYILPASSDFDAIPQDPENPLSQSKVDLGKMLFHETGLSLQSKNDKNGSWSCASCHFSKAGFQDMRMQSIADGGKGDNDLRNAWPNVAPKDMDVPAIRSPSILNVAYQENTLWNGMAGSQKANALVKDKWKKGDPHGFNHLGLGGAETQAVIALGAHRMTHENMAYETAQESLDTLDKLPEYKALFEKSFPNEKVTRETLGKAIAAYERVVLPQEAPFQRFLKGDKKALSTNEIKGAQLFFGRASCSSCHSGPALSSEGFYALGVNDMKAEFGPGPDEGTRKGRGGFTGNPQDNYKFKVPQLYNLKEVGSLGHGGSFQDSDGQSGIEKMVRYHLEGVSENKAVPKAQLANDFTKMSLESFSEAEISSLTQFVEVSLRDPNLKRYEPETLPTKNRPINN